MQLSETFSSHITNLKIAHILPFLTILQIRPIIPDFTTGHFFLDKLVLNLIFFAKLNNQKHLHQSGGQNLLFDYVLAVPWKVSPWSIHASETKAHSSTQSDQFSGVSLDGMKIGWRCFTIGYKQNPFPIGFPFPEVFQYTFFFL